MDYFFDNILLPLIIGGIGAYLYPRLESYLKNRSLSSSERRIKIILEEYRIIQSFSLDRTNLILEGIYNILLGLSTLLVFLLIFGMAVLFPSIENLGKFLNLIMLGYLAISTYMMLWKMRHRIIYVQLFKGYKKITKDKLIKLGGNPEDLDKEET